MNRTLHMAGILNLPSGIGGFTSPASRSNLNVLELLDLCSLDRLLPDSKSASNTSYEKNENVDDRNNPDGIGFAVGF
jgi:hypothetical protein